MDNNIVLVIVGLIGAFIGGWIGYDIGQMTLSKIDLVQTDDLITAYAAFPIGFALLGAAALLILFALIQVAITSHKQ